MPRVINSSRASSSTHRAEVALLTTASNHLIRSTTSGSPSRAPDCHSGIRRSAYRIRTIYNPYPSSERPKSEAAYLRWLTQTKKTSPSSYFLPPTTDVDSDIDAYWSHTNSFQPSSVPPGPTPSMAGARPVSGMGLTLAELNLGRRQSSSWELSTRLVYPLRRRSTVVA